MVVPERALVLVIFKRAGKGARTFMPAAEFGSRRSHMMRFPSRDPARITKVDLKHAHVKSQSVTKSWAGCSGANVSHNTPTEVPERELLPSLSSAHTESTKGPSDTINR